MRPNILLDETTPFGHYLVIDRTYDGRRSRLLYSGDGAPQSGLAYDDEPELLFDYIQRMLEISLSLQPKRVLIIGGGAFTLPKAMLERITLTHLDVVEIDPRLPEIAREFFDLPSDPRLHIFSQNGADFISSLRDSYDLILVDAFDEYDIPKDLLSYRATADYARILAPGGVVAFNYIGLLFGEQNQPMRSVIDAFEENFATLEIYQADHELDQNEDQNFLLVASDQPTDLPYLQSQSIDY